MAKVVNTIPERGEQVGRKTYPWHKWFDGRIWELRQGKDFKPKALGFAQQAYTKGRAFKIKVTTAVRGNRVYVQAQKTANVKGKKG